MVHLPQHVVEGKSTALFFCGIIIEKGNGIILFITSCPVRNAYIFISLVCIEKHKTDRRSLYNTVRICLGNAA